MQKKKQTSDTSCIQNGRQQEKGGQGSQFSQLRAKVDKGVFTGWSCDR